MNLNEPKYTSSQTIGPDTASQVQELKSLWRKNQRFFQANREEFKKKYPGKYVAVHNGEVIGAGDQIGELVKDLNIKYGNIPLYADKPDENEGFDMINWPLII